MLEPYRKNGGLNQKKGEKLRYIITLILMIFVSNLLFTVDSFAQRRTIKGNVKCKRVRYPENVVVSIEKVGNNIYPAPEEHEVIDQFNLTFVPHVLAVLKGTKIDFPNNDSVRHNVSSPPDCCQHFNLGTYDPGVVKTVGFDKTCEIPLLCNIHTEMSAFVAVLDNPYFSVTGKDGVFTIENVPPGTYKLNAWHESLKTVSKEVTVEAGKTAGNEFVYSL
jgi:plastocyanin